MASIASILKPSDIITKDGSPVDFTGKRIGLYFSAHVRIRLFVSSSPYSASESESVCITQRAVSRSVPMHTWFSRRDRRVAPSLLLSRRAGPRRRNLRFTCLLLACVRGKRGYTHVSLRDLTASSPTPPSSLLRSGARRAARLLPVSLRNTRNCRTAASRSFSFSCPATATKRHSTHTPRRCPSPRFPSTRRMRTAHSPRRAA